MTFFAVSKKAPRSRSQNAQLLGLFVAFILVVMLVLQLFTFERFPALLVEQFGVNESTSQVIAASMVFTELLALPFLLRMRLSVLMRMVSMVALWLVALWWAGSFLFQVVRHADTNTGLLGAAVYVPAAAPIVLLWVGVVMLVVWLSWSMWPLLSKRR